MTPETTELIKTLKQGIRQNQDMIPMYNVSNPQDVDKLYQQCKSICEKIDCIAKLEAPIS